MNADTRKKWLVIAAVGLVGLFVADRFILSPLTSRWAEHSNRIAGLRAEVAEGQALLERAEQLEQRWEAMVESSLPSNAGDAEGLVLASVNEWAGAAGVDVVALKPRWRLDSEPPVLECSVSGTGSIEQVAHFLYALEAGHESLRVEEIALSAEDEAGKALRMDLRFTGISLREIAP